MTADELAEKAGLRFGPTKVDNLIPSVRTTQIILFEGDEHQWAIGNIRHFEHPHEPEYTVTRGVKLSQAEAILAKMKELEG